MTSRPPLDHDQIRDLTPILDLEWRDYSDLKSGFLQGVRFSVFHPFLGDTNSVGAMMEHTQYSTPGELATSNSKLMSIIAFTPSRDGMVLNEKYLIVNLNYNRSSERRNVIFSVDTDEFSDIGKNYLSNVSIDLRKPSSRFYLESHPNNSTSNFIAGMCQMRYYYDLRRDWRSLNEEDSDIIDFSVNNQLVHSLTVRYESF